MKTACFFPGKPSMANLAYLKFVTTLECLGEQGEEWARLAFTSPCGSFCKKPPPYKERGADDVLPSWLSLDRGEFHGRNFMCPVGAYVAEY
jgi:hypothetical protein